MYTREDIRCADGLVRRYSLILVAILVPLLAAYVYAVILGRQMLMLAILLAAFWLGALETALYLRPALRYRAFLRDMANGLRRECSCEIHSFDPATQLQDGARVHALQVRLRDGDTRVFYLNASKTDGFPEPGKAVCITAFGRHIVDWREKE